MLGSKRTKKKQRNKYSKGVYWQGWCHPENKTRRRMMKVIDDIPNGSYYRKIGSWFEWN